MKSYVQSFVTNRLKAGRRGSQAVLPLAALIGAWSLSFAHGQEATAWSAPTLITNLVQLQQLTLDEVRQRPFTAKLRGVVTYQPPESTDWFFLQDGDAAVEIVSSGGLPRFEPGQRVEVEGELETTTFAITVTGAVVTDLGPGEMPAPADVSGEDLNTGRFHGRLVRVKGAVLDLCTEFGRPVLLNSSLGVTYNVYVSEHHDELPLHFWNGVVETTGVSVSRPNFTGRASSFYLVCSADRDIRMLRPGPENLFDQPRRTARSLQEQSELNDERVRVAGVVTFASPRGWFVVQDETGPVAINRLVPIPKYTRQGVYIPRDDPAALPVVGDAVEVVGSLIRKRPHAPALAYAEYRVTGRGDVPPPIIATAEEIMTGRPDHRWVTLDARVIDAESRVREGMHQQSFWLQAGDVVFRANLYPRGDAPPPARVGDAVRLTGLCWVNAGDGQESRSFLLYPDPPGSIAVLTPVAPWLTPPVMRVGGGAALLLVAALAWVRLLRRQVARHSSALRTGEARLQQSEERFRSAFRASPALMTITRMADGRFVAANDAFFRTSGYSEAEVIGRPARDLDLYVKDDQRVELLRQFREHGVARDREVRMRGKDGRVLTMLVSGEVLQIDGEQHVLVVAVDITTRKQAEQEIHRSLETERELGELKSRFVSLVSHEFRTPLGITMSAVELLRNYADRLPPAKREELLEDIRSSTLRMSGLMEQVLLLGRVEAGKLRFQPAPVDLPALAEKLVDETCSATGRKCPLHVRVEGCLTGAQGDEGLLRHIFSNLLSNAVKYSPENTPVDFVIARDGREAVFTVLDRGIGIPAADQPRLFEAFHRASNVGQTPGTGLGLLIVKRCVELHDGQIEVRSEAGRGTCITVRLPLFDSER